MIVGTERAELELSGFCITFLGLGAAPSAYISSGRRCAFRQPVRGFDQDQRSIGRISRLSILTGGVEKASSFNGSSVIGVFVPPVRTLSRAPLSCV